MIDFDEVYYVLEDLFVKKQIKFGQISFSTKTHNLN